ncbi:MAG: hypothetical protein KDA17_00015 [Candidatus Saccharibacteria bacterium]|nr:hypothetical protein [Candidatus Saccharibacteria bacterium]
MSRVTQEFGPDVYAPLEIIDGVKPISQFGYNGDVDSAAAEDVWSQGGSFAAPTTARVHAVVSGSANDAAAGTGARTVTIHGLDANWEEASETVTLTGTTPVNTTGSYVMINKMVVATAGSGGVAAGAITATAATDSTVTCAIEAAQNQSRQAIFAIPAGYTGVIQTVSGGCTVADASAVELSLTVKEFGGVFREVALIPSVLAAGKEKKFNPGIKVPAKSIVKLRAKANADDTTFYAGFEGLYILNTKITGAADISKSFVL